MASELNNPVTLTLTMPAADAQLMIALHAALMLDPDDTDAAEINFAILQLPVALQTLQDQMRVIANDETLGAMGMSQEDIAYLKDFTGLRYYE